MSNLNPQQFEQQTIPGTDEVSGRVRPSAADQAARLQPTRQTLLHYTDKPDFKVDPSALPEDVEGQGAERAINFFGTTEPQPWRDMGWINDRPYVARVEVTGHEYEDWQESDELPETHVFDTAKTKVLGVHRAHIFRPGYEKPRESWASPTAEGPTVLPFAHGNQASGPKVSPLQPRQPKLPGTNEPHHRPSRDLLDDLGRTNRND